ncbi:hypothetical protein JCM8097_008510 [Rhodosporidiobolus ruineniae]
MTDSPQSTEPIASPALALPNEVWLAIFRRKELSYFDLKRLSRVCKRFHGFEQSKSLDDLLFRSPPPNKPVKRGSPVRFHPTLNMTNLVCTDLELAIAIWRWEEEDKNKDASFRAALSREYATSPSTTVLEIAVADGVYIDKKKGITVLDVVEACVTMWSSQPDHETAREILEIHLSWRPKAKLEDINWFHWLYEHNGYTGLRSAEVISDGCVGLRMDSFDS